VGSVAARAVASRRRTGRCRRRAGRGGEICECGPAWGDEAERVVEGGGKRVNGSPRFVAWIGSEGRVFFRLAFLGSWDVDLYCC